MTDWSAPARMLARPGGGEVAWWEVGTGAPTLLWVHGLPLDSRSWEPQRTFFQPHTRNVFVDLRGYGRSSKLPANPGPVSQLYVDDLVALLDTIGGPAAIAIGFASAGHVVLRLAAQHGDRLAGVVAINGSPCFMQADGWPYGFDASSLDRFAAPLRNGDLEDALDRILDPATVFRDVPAADGARLSRDFREMGRLAGAETLLGFFADMALDDDRDLLGRIGLPTLLIAGAAGKEVPSGVGLYMREHIRSAALAEITGADHFVTATRPRLVNELIHDFCQAQIMHPKSPTSA